MTFATPFLEVRLELCILELHMFISLFLSQLEEYAHSWRYEEEEKEIEKRRKKNHISKVKDLSKARCIISIRRCDWHGRRRSIYCNRRTQAR